MKYFDTILDANKACVLIAEGDCVVLDCRFSLGQPERGREAFRQGHLPLAQYVHLDEDLSSPVTSHSGRHPLPPIESFSEKLSDWGISPATQVIVYDDAGGLYAARAWWMLRWCGHRRVAVLDGGIESWNSNSFELSTELHSATAPRPYPTTARQEWVFDSSDIGSGLDNGEIVLIDARGAERFAGTEEPVDPVAGHVPGAINRPATDNLNEHGRFKSSRELLGEWRNVLLNREDRRIVSMCGSGVTACHNLLSLKIAGLGDCALYAGSWSCWISDPKNPVACSEKAR